MLSNILIYLGLVTGCISAIDFFLSSKVKKKISNFTDKLWIWLEYKKALDYYKIRSNSIVLVQLSGLLFALFLYLLIFAITYDLTVSIEDAYTETELEKLKLPGIDILFELILEIAGLSYKNLRGLVSIQNKNFACVKGFSFSQFTG